jgi:hypothetical protein
MFIILARLTQKVSMVIRYRLYGFYLLNLCPSELFIAINSDSVSMISRYFLIELLVNLSITSVFRAVNHDFLTYFAVAKRDPESAIKTSSKFIIHTVTIHIKVFGNHDLVHFFGWIGGGIIDKMRAIVVRSIHCRLPAGRVKAVAFPIERIGTSLL